MGMFMLVVVLSVASLWSNGGHFGKHEGVCVAASIQGGVCPESTTLASLVFHANTLKNYQLSESVNSSLLLVTLLLILFTGLRALSKSILSQPVEIARLHAQTITPKPQTQQISHWLALHESSPSTFSGRA
ncbi:MAG: hypothetical protein HY420_01660 [Candidatus Kerfeldbacteria bacterium]|nr:hypothetical protein [Candidatus Kerfeldbacteria bacterium]